MYRLHVMDIYWQLQRVASILSPYFVERGSGLTVA
jgi:hypothetical protein